MTFHTSHAAFLSLAGQIGAVALAPVCGHSIDPTIFSISTGVTIIVGLADWYKRNFRQNSSSTPSSLV